MKELETQLLNECRKISTLVLWNRDDPKNLRDIHDADEREELAQEYFAECEDILDALIMDNMDDPYILIRAVKYICSETFPSTHLPVDLFCHRLNLLIDIACPIHGVRKGGEPFFEDLRNGMAIAESCEETTEPEWEM